MSDPAVDCIATCTTIEECVPGGCRRAMATAAMPEDGAREVDRRLFEALEQASRSPLGMPASVDTFKQWLDEAGLALTLRERG